MTQVTESIAYGMPDSEYHAVDAIGSTDVKRLLRSPAHFRAGRDEPRAPTDAMALGTLIHLSILEPERFAREVVVAPRFDRRTKGGKALAEAFKADHVGMRIVDAADFDTARRVGDAVHAHPAARALLTDGQTEASLFWADPDTGAPCKARVDYLRADGGMVDLKSAEDASPAGFSRAVARYGYLSQQAHYQSGGGLVFGNVPLFAFIAAEKEPPYAVGVYVLDADAVAAAFDRVRSAYGRYMDCVQTGQWPAYSPLIELITPPAWAL
jgi:exodeoxyribonuclease VIII